VVSGASKAAGLPVVRFRQSAVSWPRTSASRRFPPPGGSPTAPQLALLDVQRGLPRGSQWRDTYTQAVGFPIL
jgi:hypothetical protein